MLELTARPVRAPAYGEGRGRLSTPAAPSSPESGVPDDGEGRGRVLDVDVVAGQGQAVEGRRADRGALTGLGQLVDPDAHAGLGVVRVTAVMCAGDGDVGEDRVGDRVERLAADVVGLEH